MRTPTRDTYTGIRDTGTHTCIRDTDTVAGTDIDTTGVDDMSDTTGMLAGAVEGATGTGS
jgi:hypothetical protein